MPINPKRKIERLLKAAKKIPKPKTPKQKQEDLERRAKRMDYNPTTPEYIFADLLLSIKVKYETQKILEGKIFDFFIPEKNILVEIDGNYWHGHGKSIQEMNEIQLKAFHNDKKKDGIAKTAGFQLIRIWEHELDDEHYEETKTKMRQLLK